MFVYLLVLLSKIFGYIFALLSNFAKGSRISFLLNVYYCYYYGGSFKSFFLNGPPLFLFILNVFISDPPAS